MKNAILILSDPKSGAEEATARALNALAMADECLRSGDELAVAFIGAGTRWPGELSKPTHPGYARFNEVRPYVVGASCACAELNNATESLKAANVPLVSDNKVEGTSGVLSVRKFHAEGWNVTTF